jgi:hypothetical protein
MGGEQLEAETGQPGAGDTDQLGDPAGLEIEQTAATITPIRHRCRDVGCGKALDSHLTPVLRATHLIEHMFDHKSDFPNPSTNYDPRQ